MAFTEVPLQPARTPVPKPVPTEPAAPISGVPLAQRPALTTAELAAKERADRLAKKREAKAKREPKAKAKAKAVPIPGEAGADVSDVSGVPAAAEAAVDSEVRTKKAKKSRTPKKPKQAKPKQAKAEREKHGAKLRLLMVGLPVLVVLGGAGTFAYMNREKLGLGGVGPTDPVGVSVADTGVARGIADGSSAAAIPLKDDSILGPDPFASPFETPEPKVEPNEAQLEEPPQPIQFTAKELQEIVKDPRRTLEAFLLSGTVDDLLNFVTDREEVEAEIRAYYPGGNRTPIATREIVFEGSGLIPETTLSACMYWVTSQRRKIPVSVEETEAGYRVDWAAFTQFHDAKFEKFMRDPESPPGGFYVQMRRGHFFGNTVEDSDDLQVFRVQSPIAPNPDAFVFLRKSNPEASAILERYRWDSNYRPVVELKWVTPDGGEPRIELQRIIRHTWRR